MHIIMEYKDNMEYSLTWLGFDPLTIRFTGTGEQAKNELSNLSQIFADAEYDRQEEFRQEVEDRSELEIGETW